MIIYFLLFYWINDNFNIAKRSIKKKELDNRNNISGVNNYDTIFGLIPNEKHESSLLFAPKHNKSIKFENYDIHFESEKYTNQKSSRKMWNKLNWNFK